MYKYEKGQATGIQYAIVGLLAVTIVLSSVSIYLTSGQEVGAREQDVQSLESAIDDLRNSIEELSGAGKISVLSLSAKEAYTNEPFEAVATVRNTGRQQKSSTLELKMDGQTVAEKEVSVEAGETIEESFEFTPEKKGTIQLSVNGVSTTVEVKKFREISREWTMSLWENLNDEIMTPRGPGELTPKRPSGELKLTEEQKQEIRNMDIGRAYYLAGTLDITEILNNAGINSILEDLGKKEVKFMGCSSVDEQISQVETLMAKKEEVAFLGAQPYASVPTGPAFSRLSDAGVPVSGVWSIPKGLMETSNFGGLIDVDGYAEGAGAAEILCKAMGYNGQVGIVDFGMELWTTTTRRWGAENRFAEYPNVEVVDRRSFTDPGKTYDLVTSMLQSHPEIDGIWLTWMLPPGFQAAEAAKSLGMEDQVVIAAPDLGGKEGARHIADPEDPIIGAVAADCIGMGKAVARAGLQNMLGNKEVVQDLYATAKVFPITRSNLEHGWVAQTQGELGPLPQSILRLLE